MATRTCHDCVYCARAYNEDISSDGNDHCMAKPKNPTISDISEAESCKSFYDFFDYDDQDGQ